LLEAIHQPTAVCSKQPSRDNCCKAPYPRTQQRDATRVGVEFRSHGRCKSGIFNPLDHAADNDYWEAKAIKI